MPSRRHPLELLARNLDLRCELPRRDRQALLDLPHVLQTLEASACIIREGDSFHSFAVLVSGFAFRQKLTGDGSRQIVALHIPGDALDFQNLFLDTSDHSIQMLTQGQVAFLSRSDVQDLARSHPVIGQAILVKILVEASVLREWVLNVGRRDSRTSMAHIFCELGARLDAEGLADEYGYHLPMTQEQLADALGLTTIHVNRTLKSLAADGLITQSKRTISFPDWQRLRTTADFNPRYLHLKTARSPA